MAENPWAPACEPTSPTFVSDMTAIRKQIAAGEMKPAPIKLASHRGVLTMGTPGEVREDEPATTTRRPYRPTTQADLFEDEI